MPSPESPRPEAIPMLPSKSDGEAGAEKTKLRRELTLVDGASIIIGIIVGSGIFVSPKGVLQYSGSVGLSCIIWLLSGLLSFIGADWFTRDCALIGWILTLLKQALLCHKDTAQGTQIPPLRGIFCLSLCLYGIRVAFMHRQDLL